MRMEIALATAAQQETEAFKKWFGKSKVVDANGKALRVYHGTRSEFRAFDKRLLGKGNDEQGIGFYFSSDPSDTVNYSGITGNTLPVYLKITNPIYFDKQPDLTRSQARTIAFGAGRERFYQFIRDNYDVDFQGMQPSIAEYLDSCSGYDMVQASFHLFNDIYAGSGYEHLFAQNFKLATKRDGVIIKHQGSTHYVVFSPTQIKSAVGNKGTFKPRTADLTE